MTTEKSIPLMAGSTHEIRALLWPYIDGGMTPDEAAAAVVDAVDPSALPDLVRPVVAKIAAEMVRKRVRSRERRAWGGIPDTLTWDASPLMAGAVGPWREFMAQISPILDDVFILPDRLRVTWREATVDQHKERAAMLSELADRVLETMQSHRTAAAILTEARVDSLGELQEKLAA